eukprot:c10044_g1_i1.p1 GENE.c10044_g1_i1~~c10044_g1_i1.p1  ORF type:complete len:208 (+),score=91.81 c10044_g1_i1:61-684(+)
MRRNRIFLFLSLFSLLINASPTSKNPEKESTEAISSNKILDAVVESGEKNNVIFEDCVDTKTKNPPSTTEETSQKPCTEKNNNTPMTLVDVYGEDVVNDAMTGGVRGVSIKVAPGGPSVVPSYPILDQDAITLKCDPRVKEQENKNSTLPEPELPPCPRVSKSRPLLRGDKRKSPEYLLFESNDPFTGPKSNRVPCAPPVIVPYVQP